MKNKMKGLTFNIAFLFICLMATIGFITSITAVHEFSHYLDYKNIEKTNESMCVLNVPLGLNSHKIGYYGFSFNKNYSLDVEEIDRYTEKKAYLLTFVGIAFFLVCMSVIFMLKVKASLFDEIVSAKNL